MRLPEVKEAESLDKRYPKLPAAVLDLAKVICPSSATEEDAL